MSQEEWKDINGYEGLYKIAKDGRVMSLRGPHGQPQERLLVIQCKASGGYYSLHKDGSRKQKAVNLLRDEHFPELNLRPNRSGRKPTFDVQGDVIKPYFSTRSQMIPAVIPVDNERFMTLVCAEYAKHTNFTHGVPMKAMMKALTAAATQCGFYTSEKVLKS